MFWKSRRPIIVTACLVVLASIGGALWLAMASGWLTPAPTKFGWAAALTNVAGDGVRGRGDGGGAKARFGDPFAVAQDANGTLYVADAGDIGRVRKIRPDGRVTTLAATFDTPSGLALDRAGNIFVAETGANTIRRIAPDGIVTTIAGDGIAGYRDGAAAQARFNGPIGIAVDATGNVYVADSYNDRIRVITPEGQVRTIAGGDAPGFADGQGAGAAFDTPTGLALDHEGRLLVADTGNDAIRRVDPDGRVATLAWSDPNGDAGVLKGPIGLAPTWDGYVYIACYRRGRIVQLSPTGELRVLAGSGSPIAGNAVSLIGPAGLALDPAGALYVADASAYAVRKLSPRQADTAPPAPFPDPAPPALVRKPAFPWPVAPQLGWHEVVGDMGEVRGNYQGESRDHLHAGLDISAPVGAAVLASADEVVRDPLPNWDAEGLGEGLRIDQVTYIHMRVGRSASGEPIDPARFQLIRDADGRVTRVRVKRGARFRVGDTLGTINRMAHVHLELGPPRGKVNALALHFPGFGDHVAPHITEIYLLGPGDQRLAEIDKGRVVIPAAGRAVGIVADAWDQVDHNAPRRRLGLYRAGYQILKADGSPVRGFERPRITLDFDRMLTAPDAVKIAYAPDSGDTVHSDGQTRFLYVVSNVVRDGRAERGGWNPADVAPGDYIVRVFAADRAGNIASTGRDLAVTIR